MDKLLGEEEDLKGLEDEIDDAVDRLFVEKKGGVTERFLTEPELSEPPLKSPVSEPAMKPSTLEPSMHSPILEIDDAVDRLLVEKKGGVTERFLMEPEFSEPPLKSSVLEPAMKPSTLEPSMHSPILEIDDAVDRLFVEKKGGVTESFLMEPEFSEPPLKSSVLEPAMRPPILEPLAKSPISGTPPKSFLSEPSYGTEKTFDSESSVRPPSTPVPFLKSIEQMEAQLLSLEWEITDGKLKKTKEEVLALRELLKHKADIASILDYMERALSYMIQDEGNIRPPWIKFLLDSKDTIKLLMRKETEGEINTYKQLAYLGLEARFSCLGGTPDGHANRPSRDERKAIERTEVPIPGEKKIEDMSKKMDLFMEGVEVIFRTMKQQISRLEETTRKPPAPSVEAKSKHVNVTIFRVDEELFGVETEKIFKLFKVPVSFHEKYSDQARIRLRDLEVKMVNLKKIFSIPGGEHTGEMRILTVKDNGEYKGLMVDQVLKRLSATSEVGGSYGEFFSGRVCLTYQEQLVEIPILDLKKF
jgi:hypothetical protein